MTTALITGASSGIGAAFADRLAADGHDLVLVARSVDVMEEHAERLRRAHGITVDVIGQDLAEPDAPARVVAALAGKPVDLLVNNAGFGTCGRFEDIEAERDRRQIMVNIAALVGLTHALVPGMLARGGGGVVNVASTAAFQTSPHFSVYSSAKTFVLNFSLALWAEYRGRGVNVLALCPGPVETAFFDVIGTREAAVGGKFMTADRVVDSALKALARNRGYVVPGRSNFALAHLMPRRPRKLVALIAKRVTRAVASPAGRSETVAATA
ncbi:MAG TPA: SDR family oxidoreductase [Phytomonospora sp.]